jgi:hypothetical protein
MIPTFCMIIAACVIYAPRLTVISSARNAPSSAGASPSGTRADTFQQSQGNATVPKEKEQTRCIGTVGRSQQHLWQCLL